MYFLVYLKKVKRTASAIVMGDAVRFTKCLHLPTVITFPFPFVLLGCDQDQQ
jgi:hypothetical protein